MADNLFSKSGYSEEDHFMKNAEAEKIQQIRDKRAAQKKELEKELYWMKCPKCGNDMEEIEVEKIMIDKCKSCNGIYFDDGELELLISNKQGSSFFGSVRGFWK
jgi:acetyl-CoA carboxylase beta subunit